MKSFIVFKLVYLCAVSSDVIGGQDNETLYANSTTRFLSSLDDDEDVCEEESSWIPGCWKFFRGTSGLGPDCFAVWTDQWFQKYYDLPKGLLAKITNPKLIAHLRKRQCPFGISLPGQVTWPFPPSDLEDVVVQPNVLKVLCVLWSYVPYLVAGRALISFIWTLLFGNYDPFSCPRRQDRELDVRSSFLLSDSILDGTSMTMTVDLPVITGSAMGSGFTESAIQTLGHLRQIRDKIQDLEDKLTEAKQEEQQEMKKLKQLQATTNREAADPQNMVSGEDGPGLYTVIVGHACVSDSPDEVFYDQAVYLNKDAIVTVLYVVRNSRGIRAKIQEPIGWITLVNRKNQRLLARKHVPNHYCTSRQLNCLFFLMFLMTIQEGFLKKLIQEPRPGALMQLKSNNGYYAGSCITSCGMPSSHSALAVGWFTTIFLEARDNLILSTSPSTKLHFSLRRIVKWMVCEFAPLKPWTTSRGTLSRWAFTGYIFTWGILMLPVPFARVVLYDHTTMQCFYGMLIGFWAAVFWWVLVLGCFRTSLDSNEPGRWQLPSWIVREL